MFISTFMSTFNSRFWTEVENKKGKFACQRLKHFKPTVAGMDICCGFKRCTVLSSYFNFNPDSNGKKVEKNRQGSLKSSVFKMIRFENMS